MHALYGKFTYASLHAMLKCCSPSHNPASFAMSFKLLCGFHPFPLAIPKLAIHKIVKVSIFWRSAISRLEDVNVSIFRVQRALSMTHSWPYYPSSLEIASALAQQRGEPTAAALLGIHTSASGTTWSTGASTPSPSL